MIEEIKAFKTSDGKVFTDEKQATRHESRNQLEADLWEIFKCEFWNGMGADDAIGSIMSYSDELFAALKKSGVS